MEIGWPILINPWAIILASGFAGFTGISFGLYPAHRPRGLIRLWHYVSNRPKIDSHLPSSFSRAWSPSGQTRTSSLRAARPLPPSADIGPGGQTLRKDGRGKKGKASETDAFSQTRLKEAHIIAGFRARPAARPYSRP